MIGFICARSVSVCCEIETNQALKEFLRKFGKWIKGYVLRCIQGKKDRCNWTLSGHTVSKELMTALAQEYFRDRQGLMRFLQAVFKRWQEIDQPNSLWRVRLITQQHLGEPKVVTQYVENIGAVSKCTNERHFESLRAKIKQYCSRDRKKALEKREKAR